MTGKERLIPPILSAQRVLPQAMIDHVEIALGDWPVGGPPQQVLRFLDAIPEILCQTISGVLIPAFTSTNRSDNGRRIEVGLSRGRPGNIVYQTRPIVGGRLEHVWGVGRVPRQTPGEYVRLGLDGHLNVNHFLMAQNVRLTPPLGSSRLTRPLATAIEERFALYGDEYCLTDDTNVLIGPDRLYRYVLSKPAEEHFMDHIRLIEDFLSTELRETASSYGDVTFRHARYYSLQKIEFVWEFFHPNPIRFVEGLDVPMRALGPESRRHRALVRGEGLNTMQDSISVSAELSSGCNLVVYAKTNERIRFEVRLNRDAIAAILRRVRGDAHRTARNHEDLRHMIQILREAATARMEVALSMLDRRRIPPASNVTAMQLCALVGRILQDDRLAHTVLESLRMRGSFASPLRSPVRDAVLRLVSEKIMRRAAPRSNVFVPTDRYVRAVGELRTSLAGRIRRVSPGNPRASNTQGPRRGILRRRHVPK